MSLVFLRTKTDNGPRTIVFSAGEDQARLLADTAIFDEIAILPSRPAYASVAQIVAQRTQELDRELAIIKRRNARRAAKRPDLFSNVTKLFPAKGKKHDTGRSLRKR